MIKILSSKNFFLSFFAFILLNTALYSFMFLFHNRVPFDYKNYVINSHHHTDDKRVTERKFDFINALGQFDSQWYLKIADEGYPRSPVVTNIRNKSVLDGLSYAFFPFYPLLLSKVNLIFNNLELSAFVFSNFLMVVNFVSLYFVITKIFSEKIAIKSIFLLFSFPFSIFYRSYFTEGLFLFFIVWFSYFLYFNKYFISSVMLGILNLTKGNGFLLNAVFMYYFLRHIGDKQTLIRLREVVLNITLILGPFLIFLCYVFLQTSSFTYFFEVRSNWVPNEFPLFRLLKNIFSVITFPTLSFHFFHSSMVDAVVVITTAILLFLSRKKIPVKIWFVSFSLWLTPLLFSDLISFARHQSVSFPLFLYLSMVLRGYKYQFLLSVFLLGLFVVSLFFINWYWVG